jgi:DNA-binding NarL/FixJ family response regulator
VANAIRYSLIADKNQFFAAGLETALDQNPSVGRVHSVYSRDALFTCLQSTQGFNLLFVCAEILSDDWHADITQLTSNYPALSIIIMSDYADRAQIFSFLASGAHGFFRKSDSKSELQMAVSVVLRGRVYLPSEIPVHPSISTSANSSDNADLTSRQNQVLDLVAAGYSNKEIARKLNIAEATVKVHLAAIFRQFGVHNRTGAVAHIHSMAGAMRATA